MSWAKLRPRNFSDILLGAIVLYFLYRQAPAILNHWQMEGGLIPQFSVTRLDGSVFASRGDSGSQVIVFWATWCGPCGVELSRIQSLVDAGKIDPSDVIAISSHEESSVVAKIVGERGYTFGVGLDPGGSAAAAMKVNATPTIVFKDSAHRMVWVSSGVSPTLGVRLESFLNP